MNKQTAKLARLNAARTRQRDRMILSIGRDINQWAAVLTQRLVGIVATRDGMGGVGAAVEMVAESALQQLAAILESGLGRIVNWGVRSAADNMIRSLPMRFWLARATQLDRPARATEGKMDTVVSKPAAVEISTVSTLEYSGLGMNSLIDRILSGKADAEESMDIIRAIEFPAPSAAKVRRILSGGYDGVDAMSRIKTVAKADIATLRQRITLSLSATNLYDDEASAIQALTASIKELVGNDPGKPTGMAYRARRIARTEGVRVAEASLRESWASTKDLFSGIRTQRAGGEPCELCDPYDDVVFWDDGHGQYVSDDGRRLPDFPIHPNCMCFTTPELADDLTKDLPDADYGSWYDASRKRAADELAAVMN
jgi:hypothetical protein